MVSALTNPLSRYLADSASRRTVLGAALAGSSLSLRSVVATQEETPQAMERVWSAVGGSDPRGGGCGWRDRRSRARDGGGGGRWASIDLAPDEQRGAHR